MPRQAERWAPPPHVRLRARHLPFRSLPTRVPPTMPGLSLLKRSLRTRIERGMPRVCYSHVPKCGGMSIGSSIAAQHFRWHERRALPSFSVDLRASAKAARATGRSMMSVREEVLAYALAQNRYRFVTGHVMCRPRLVDEFQDTWHFVTVLRDPVERWVSEYVYNTRKESSWARNDLPVEAYLETPKARVTATSYLRYFSSIPEDFQGDPDPYVDEAVENLSRFAVVGVLEDLDEFVRRYESRFSRPLAIPRINRSPADELKKRLSSDERVMAQVRRMCEPDSLVYARVAAGLTPA